MRLGQYMLIVHQVYKEKEHNGLDQTVYGLVTNKI